MTGCFSSSRLKALALRCISEPKVLTEIGLTRQNYTFENIEIFVNSNKVFENGEFSSADIEPKIFNPETPAKNIKINLLKYFNHRRKNEKISKHIQTMGAILKFL